MAHSATLTFDLGDHADAILKALEPEAREGPEGTDTQLRLDGATMVVDITAGDLSGLRAAIHSVTRLLDAAQRTLA